MVFPADGAYSQRELVCFEPDPETPRSTRQCRGDRLRMHEYIYTSSQYKKYQRTQYCFDENITGSTSQIK